MDPFDHDDSQWTALQASSAELKDSFTNGPIPVSGDKIIQALSALQDYAEGQKKLNRLLQHSLEDIPVEDLYQQLLEEVLSFSNIDIKSQGLLFLTEDQHLVIKAHKNIPGELLARCSRIPYGACLCGKAVAEKKVIFADSTHSDHVFTSAPVPYSLLCPHPEPLPGRSLAV